MKAGSDKRKNKIFVRGSMALEMALTLPLLLILVFVFYGHVREIDQSLSARHALDQVANEIELLYPLSDLIAFETELNETAIAKVLDELGLKDYALDLSGDVVASLLSGPVLNQRYDYWLEQTCAARGQTVPQGERRFFVDYVSEKNLIYLGLSYQRTSLLAEGEEYIKSSTISQIKIRRGRKKPITFGACQIFSGVWNSGRSTEQICRPPILALRAGRRELPFQLRAWILQHLLGRHKAQRKSASIPTLMSCPFLKAGARMWDRK